MLLRPRARYDNSTMNDNYPPWVLWTCRIICAGLVVVLALKMSGTMERDYSRDLVGEEDPCCTKGLDTHVKAGGRTADVTRACHPLALWCGGLIPFLDCTDSTRFRSSVIMPEPQSNVTPPVLRRTGDRSDRCRAQHCAAYGEACLDICSCLVPNGAGGAGQPVR